MPAENRDIGEVFAVSGNEHNRMHLVVGTDIGKAIGILSGDLNRIAENSHSLLLVVVSHDLSCFFRGLIRGNNGNENTFSGLTAGK